MAKTKTVSLEACNVLATRILDEEKLFNDPAVYLARPENTDAIVLRLIDYVWAEELQTDKVIWEVPATWWDHFKRDGIPRITRLLGLEVKMKTKGYSWRRAAWFPEFRHHPEAGEYVIHEQVTEYPYDPEEM